MPIVQIHMLEGRDLEKKRKLAKSVTEAVCESLGVKPEKVRVILSEMPHDDFAIAGTLHCDEAKA